MQCQDCNGTGLASKEALCAPCEGSGQVAENTASAAAIESAVPDAAPIVDSIVDASQAAPAKPKRIRKAK